MAFLGSLLLFSLVIHACVGQFGIQETGRQKICLYDKDSKQRLAPLQLTNANCAGGTTNCMNTIYKYKDFKYNGDAKLKPAKGEVSIFLSQDQQGKIDFVSFVNANVDVTSKVWVQITGAEPTDILLYDDPAPSDTWIWDSASNTGNFSWTTKPDYTDGVVIGHINFIDNYCVRTSYDQTKGAISKLSVLSGNFSNPVRQLSRTYTPGLVFEFCQYPVTESTHVDATCPGRNDGSASISIVFGPTNVAYRWYNEAGNQIASTASVTGLAAGTYRIFVNDTNDACNADRVITIKDHTLLGAFVTTTKFTCTTSGSASATPNGGSSGFTYTWFRPDGTQAGTGTSVSNLRPGSHYVIVTDSCGSSARTNFEITSTGCCGDGICSATEACGTQTFCAADCGVCCPPGTYINGKTCTVCPPGSRSNTLQATSCTACPANTFNAGGNETCEACPTNFRSAAGSGKCMRCPAGQVRSTTETACHTCGAGNYAAPCDSSACAVCAAGTFSADGAYFCKSCPAGTFSRPGSSSCQDCSAGWYSVAGSEMCTQCPAGTTTPSAGATHWLACA